MKSLFFSLLFLFTTLSVSAQTLYVKTYGNKSNQPILFVHGGPSGNATLFESTAAQTLADKGFFVIAFDRRGEGRSIDSTAKITYQEAFDDINGIFKKYNLEKSSIIGHSFGGLVATLYTAKYPQKVTSLVLVGALFSQQETYDHILKTVGKIYTDKGDEGKLKRVTEVASLDKNSAEYRKACYELASENNYFKMPYPTPEANRLRSEYEASEFGKTNIRNKNAPFVFYKNEKLKNIDTKPVLRKIKKENVKLFAIYGKNDGIFSKSQLTDMENIVSKNNFVLIENCSHYPFVDQREIFVNTVQKLLKK